MSTYVVTLAVSSDDDEVASRLAHAVADFTEDIVGLAGDD